MTDKFSVSEVFLNASAPLTPKDAVAAIIVDGNDHVLLQLRDDKDGIFFPHHWGCFGGAMDPNEKPDETLRRELEEELGMAFLPASIASFITISFNAKPDARRNLARYFFVVRMADDVSLQHVRLGEGSDCSFFSYKDIMRLPNVTPYDRFALWLYFNQRRLSE